MIYDLIIIGGGISGATLARALAVQGAHVLVLERERIFKDLVRGEGILPWGVAEARAIGIYETLRNICGHEVRWWRWLPEPVAQRDLLATTPHNAGTLNFHHPVMQTVLLDSAAAAGAEVRRGATVIGMTPGNPTTVVIQSAGVEDIVSGRLIVGADGRNSMTRRWGDFDVRRDPQRLVIVGGLFEGLHVSEDTIQHVWNPPAGQVLVFPLGNRRYRCYFGYHKHGKLPLSNAARRVDDFVAACTDIGAPADWYAEARPAGPLAAFEGADVWVEHPYCGGVALVGDAAATSDPNWGCGLSLALRDARILRDRLLASDDWDQAANRYAEDHDRYYGALHRIEAWSTELYFAPGAEADARRARALPKLAEEPERGLDIIGLGPDAPSDERARRRFFGDD